MIHPKTTMILAMFVTQNANLLCCGFLLDADNNAETPPKCWRMTKTTTKIPKIREYHTSKDVKLFDQSPFLPLSEPWQVSVESSSD